MTWQPIETAPKDGSVIRVRNGEMECDARFVGGEWLAHPMRYGLGPARHTDDPTHWMPLPPPPQSHDELGARA